MVMQSRAPWRRIGASFAAGLLVVTVACGNSSSSNPTEDVKSVPFKIGSFVAPTILLIGQAQNNFANLSMTTFDLDSGATAIPLMVTGDLAGASDISEPPIVIAYSKDVKMQIVWLTSFTPGDLVVKAGITDLRGKTIAAPGGSLTEYLLEQYLQKHGLSLSDIKYVDLSPQNSVSAFKTGAIDGAYQYTPFTEAMMSAGGRSLDHQQIFNYDAFSQKFIDAHPAVVQAFVCDMAKTQSAFIADPTQGWSALSQKLGISVSDLQTSMPVNSIAPPSQMLTANYMGSPTVAPNLATQIAGIGAWMVQQNRVTKAPTAADAAQLFNRDFAKKAISGSCS